MRLSPRDAQMFWLASRIPNDQFLLYCFDGADTETDAVVARLLARANQIPDLRLRIYEVPRHLDYPYWQQCPVTPDAVIVHKLADSTWPGFTAAMADVLTKQLDGRIRPWRLHLFPAVSGAPECDEVALIVVLQMSHALADGTGASALARLLLSSASLSEPTRRPPRTFPPKVLAALAIPRFPVQFVRTLIRGKRAHEARLQLAELTARGEIPPEVPGQQLISVNAAPGPEREVRMIVRSAADLRAPGVTITVAVLTAVGSALARYEARNGGPAPVRLGAEVLVATSSSSATRNNFGNVGVDLFPDEPNLLVRAAKITAALDDRRRRAAHPLHEAQRAVTAGMPATAMWQGITRFPLDVPPPTVSGNTVVSSVFRGPADLELGGGPVRFTAGFPALSPSMALTHGVHGIGDTVTISLTTGRAAIADIDVYADLLRDALTDVAAALADQQSWPG